MVKEVGRCHVGEGKEAVAMTEDIGYRERRRALQHSSRSRSRKRNRVTKTEIETNTNTNTNTDTVIDRLKNDQWWGDLQVPTLIPEPRAPLNLTPHHAGSPMHASIYTI